MGLRLVHDNRMPAACRWVERLKLARGLLHAARDALSGSASSGTLPVPLATSSRCSSISKALADCLSGQHEQLCEGLQFPQLVLLYLPKIFVDMPPGSRRCSSRRRCWRTRQRPQWPLWSRRRRRCSGGPRSTAAIKHTAAALSSTVQRVLQATLALPHAGHLLVRCPSNWQPRGTWRTSPGCWKAHAAAL